jgi:hypothetical protein
MEQYFALFKGNSSAVMSLSTALISAAVAIVILVLSQWALSRRSRKELLTSKLEELYLLINQVGERNVERFELFVKLANKEIKFNDINVNETIKIYGLDINKKIVMLIRLYFPQLSATHQKFFDANRKINKLIYDLSHDKETNDNEVNTIFFEYLDLLKIFEEEIIQNKDVLVKAYLFPRIYKKLHNSANSANTKTSTKQ